MFPRIDGGGSIRGKADVMRIVLLALRALLVFFLAYGLGLSVFYTTPALNGASGTVQGALTIISASHATAGTAALMRRAMY